MIRILPIGLLMVMFQPLLASGEAGAAHEGGWMEKWLSFDPGLFLWSIVTFLVVLAVLKWKAWEPLMITLERRETEISNALEKAAAARDEAKRVSEQYDEMVQKAQAEAQKIVANGKATGERLREEIERTARENADKILAKAHVQIESEREKAIKEIRSAVVELSISAATKVLEKNMDTDQNRRLISDTLKEVGQA